MEAGERRTIAVAPHEVVPVSKALSLGLEVVCVARSGQPANGAALRIGQERAPVEQIQVIEQITGRRRELEVFATGDDTMESGAQPVSSAAEPNSSIPSPKSAVPVVPAKSP